LALAGCIAFCTAGSDSAEAGTFLKNGVKAHDRSGLRTIRPPAPGERRFSRPSPGQRARPRAQPSQAWFWEITEPGIAAASPARWASAIETLREARRERAPLYGERLLRRIAERWGAEIRTAARRHEISEALLLAVVTVESAGRPRARSPKGAMGLMQLIPATAQRFGVRDAYDSHQNVHGGAAYLDFLLEHFEGDPLLTLAGYNAGEGAVMRHRGVPPYAETRDYVVRVLDALVAAEPLCPRPPETPRAACAFRLPKSVTPPA
jgi:soluble lytic murein transglycosylase-like protein